MKRKLRLKRNVKIMLALVIAFISMLVVLTVALKRWDDVSSECDNDMGRTCTYYEIIRHR